LRSAQQPGSEERFAFDPGHNMLPPQQAQGGRITNSRLEVFEDKRYRYDTHGNLIEKKIGRHTAIAFVWDVEHQLTEAHVTRNGVTQHFHYQYDAFGRRIAKRDAFGQTLFTWDGNLLLSEERGSRETFYLYEPQSYAPLAQVVGEAVKFPDEAQIPEELRATHDEGEGEGEKEGDEDEDWNPRASRREFEQRMWSMQRHLRGLAENAANEPPPRFHDVRVVPESRPRNWQVRYYHTDHLGGTLREPDRRRWQPALERPLPGLGQRAPGRMAAGE
jgi:YD repeat-containing protein